MAHMIKFDDNPHGRHPLCLACEEMLTDALDQTLSPINQAWFDRHVASCVHCSDMLADAQRGAAWLELLKAPRPEPSATLVERILAQTSGREQHDSLLSPIIIGQPSIIPAAAPARGNLLAFRPRLPKFAVSVWTNPHRQRLAMTAAMAFFSIALTLNLTGVRLDQLHASSLNPSNVRKTYYEASADAVRYYDNLRVVRVVESRVDDLRDTTDSNKRNESPSPAPKPEPQSKPTPKDPNGPSSRTLPGAPSQTASPFEVGSIPSLHAEEVLKGRGFSRAAANANSSGFSRRGNAQGPTQLVGLSIPNRPIQVHLPKQEGGLA